MNQSPMSAAQVRLLIAIIGITAIVVLIAGCSDEQLVRQTPTTGEDAAPYIAAIEGVQEEGVGGAESFTIEEFMAELGVPGVSVAVVRDFEIHWAKGYGVADVETGAPVDTETMFQAASISKPVAAMGSLKAVQDGLFGLDDDVNDILTSWTLDGGGHTTDRAVTPRGLMSHVSGMGDGFGYPGYDPADPIPTIIENLEGRDPSNTPEIFMERPPMTAFEYSGGGVTLQQLVLQDARGRPFADVMRSDVLDPIGMTRSTYENPLPAHYDENAARAHDGEGASMGSKWHVYPEMAAAGLWTTPSDLARLMIEVQKSLRGESNRVLNQAVTRELVTPVGVGSYAVGFGVGQDGEGWYFSHGGSNWGFRATFIGHVRHGYGAVVMTNASQGSGVAFELRRRIARAYGWDSVAEPAPRGYRPS